MEWRWSKFTPASNLLKIFGGCSYAPAHVRCVNVRNSTSSVHWTATLHHLCTGLFWSKIYSKDSIMWYGLSCIENCYIEMTTWCCSTIVECHNQSEQKKVLSSSIMAMTEHILVFCKFIVFKILWSLLFQETLKFSPLGMKKNLLNKVANFCSTKPFCCGILSENDTPSFLLKDSNALFSPALLQQIYFTSFPYFSFRSLITPNTFTARSRFLSRRNSTLWW